MNPSAQTYTSISASQQIPVCGTTRNVTFARAPARKAKNWGRICERQEQGSLWGHVKEILQEEMMLTLRRHPAFSNRSRHESCSPNWTRWKRRKPHGRVPSPNTQLLGGDQPHFLRDLPKSRPCPSSPPFGLSISISPSHPSSHARPLAGGGDSRGPPAGPAARHTLRGRRRPGSSCLGPASSPALLESSLLFRSCYGVIFRKR